MEEVISLSTKTSVTALQADLQQGFRQFVEPYRSLSRGDDDCSQHLDELSPGSLGTNNLSVHGQCCIAKFSVISGADLKQEIPGGPVVSSQTSILAARQELLAALDGVGDLEGGLGDDAEEGEEGGEPEEETRRPRHPS